MKQPSRTEGIQSKLPIVTAALAAGAFAAGVLWNSALLFLLVGPLLLIFSALAFMLRGNKSAIIVMVTIVLALLACAVLYFIALGYGIRHSHGYIF
jgi:hypothetical protein